MASFGYARPVSLEETFALLGATPDARVLCGGTDLIVALRKRRIRPSLVIDIKNVPELSGIAETDGTLRIGATTILTRVTADDRVRVWFPALVEAMNVVGSIQIRNRATLGGNLVNASPAADTAPPLLVYGASLELAGAGGTRRLPLAEFFTGPGRTVIAPGEIVTAVLIPAPAVAAGSAFGRMTRRRGVDLATVNLACLVSASGETRFAFGAVGPRPFLVTDESGKLADPATPPAEQTRAIAALTAQATPISNVRASLEYRQAVLEVLSRRALAVAQQRLRERAAAHG